MKPLLNYLWLQVPTSSIPTITINLLKVEEYLFLQYVLFDVSIFTYSEQSTYVLHLYALFWSEFKMFNLISK